MVSGINAGANVGINVFYSGTVAAAFEAAFLGVPAIATSLYLRKNITTDFARAADLSRAVIELILKAPGFPRAGWRASTFLLCWRASSRRGFGLSGNARDRLPMHTIGERIPPAAITIGTAACSPWAKQTPTGRRSSPRQRYITVTPLKFDLTQHEQTRNWAAEPWKLD